MLLLLSMTLMMIPLCHGYCYCSCFRIYSIYSFQVGLLVGGPFGRLARYYCLSYFGCFCIYVSVIITITIIFLCLYLCFYCCCYCCLIPHPSAATLLYLLLMIRDDQIWCSMW